MTGLLAFVINKDHGQWQQYTCHGVFIISVSRITAPVASGTPSPPTELLVLRWFYECDIRIIKIPVLPHHKTTSPISPLHAWSSASATFYTYNVHPIPIPNAGGSTSFSILSLKVNPPSHPFAFSILRLQASTQLILCKHTSSELMLTVTVHTVIHHPRGVGFVHHCTM